MVFHSLITNLIKDQEVQEEYSPWTTWPLKMGPICCPETSVKDYHLTLRYTPEEHSSHVHILSIYFSENRVIITLPSMPTSVK
jgi:hypothetical protein